MEFLKKMFKQSIGIWEKENRNGKTEQTENKKCMSTVPFYSDFYIHAAYECFPSDRLGQMRLKFPRFNLGQLQTH